MDVWRVMRLGSSNYLLFSLGDCFVCLFLNTLLKIEMDGETLLPIHPMGHNQSVICDFNEMIWHAFTGEGTSFCLWVQVANLNSTSLYLCAYGNRIKVKYGVLFFNVLVRDHRVRHRIEKGLFDGVPGNTPMN